MTIVKLASGSYRIQVRDPKTGLKISATKVLGLTELPTKKAEAKRIRELAKEKLRGGHEFGPTLAQFWERWTTDPIFARPKGSTNMHNLERTRAFVEGHPGMRMRDVDDDVVSDWIAGGKNVGTIPALRAMFNDAASAKAGRVVDGNPFARLGIRKGKGNANKQPPSEEMVQLLIAKGRELSGPHFGAWLQTACFTGMRPGELDALRWTAVDLGAGSIRVSEQFSAKTKTFTTPKNGRARDVPLTPPAREALLGLRQEGHEFCFETFRGTHFTPAARQYHWKAVRAAAGWDGSLYLATRHFAGWYMINVLELASEDVAIALGHEDGGELVRRLYGHRDRAMALERVQRAYESAGNVRQLRPVREESA